MKEPERSLSALALGMVIGILIMGVAWAFWWRYQKPPATASGFDDWRPVAEAVIQTVQASQATARARLSAMETAAAPTATPTPDPGAACDWRLNQMRQTWLEAMAEYRGVDWQADIVRSAGHDLLLQLEYVRECYRQVLGGHR